MCSLSDNININLTKITLVIFSNAFRFCHFPGSSPRFKLALFFKTEKIKEGKVAFPLKFL